MANTGKKIVLTLKEVAQPGNTPTGQTKDNNPLDINYIAPYIDTEDCPITYNMVCPVVIFTRSGSTLVYEFNMSNEVVKNPAVKKIRVRTSLGSFSHTYTIPNAPSENFFANTFTGLNVVLTYNLIIEFLGESDAVLHTCNVNT